MFRAKTVSRVTRMQVCPNRETDRKWLFLRKIDKTLLSQFKTWYYILYSNHKHNL